MVISILITLLYMSLVGNGKVNLFIHYKMTGEDLRSSIVDVYIKEPIMGLLHIIVDTYLCIRCCMFPNEIGPFVEESLKTMGIGDERK